MRARSVGGRWWAAAVSTLLVVAAAWLAGCTASSVAGNPGGAGRSTIGPGETTVRLLQMNLCNSGRADCYSGGRAISTAAVLIGRHRPDVVSLNEVCRGDVAVLKSAMTDAFGGAAVASGFRPAEDRATWGSVRCQNGQDFGDGILVEIPPEARSRILSGVYPTQDPHDVEERVWVCVDLSSSYSACTTHAASTSTAIALAQCRYLLSSAAQRMRHRGDGKRIIFAGDLNVAARGAPNLQACVPDGYVRADDGDLQALVATPPIAVRSRSIIDMHGTTDHPGLLVDLLLPRR
jgi:hypothetical protein